jgi:transcriptional regulator with XRE-family HTH domain
MAKSTALGNRILELRKKLGMTQTDLAQKIGVSKGAISHFEKSISKPSNETLTKLSEALGEDLRKHIPHIGRFPVLTTENNIDVAIIPRHRLQWDHLRRDESALPDIEEEVQYGRSNAKYAYDALSLPPSMLEEGQYRAYPVFNSQMEPTFEEGDFLLCSLVEDKQEWNKMGADTDNPEEISALSVYVVEVWKEKERSFHFGRFSINEKRKTLRCHLDDYSMPYRIPLADIKGVWKFRWCLTSRSRNQSQKLLNRIKELEYKLAEMNSDKSLSKGPADVSVYRTFRDRLREIIVGQQIMEGEFLQGDYIELATDKRVQELYVREYGPIQDSQSYMKLMEGTILEMVRKLAPEVKKSFANDSAVKQKGSGVSGDFRDDLKVLLQGSLKRREDLYKLDQIALANEDKVKDLYINEYGLIVDDKAYLNHAINTIQSVAFEISLEFPYVPNDNMEQNEI